MVKKTSWRNRELREHIAVTDEKISPHCILTNGTYLNVFTNQWLKANVWIYNNRIIYVGEKLPENLRGIEIVDCEGQYLVPGYIEPHAFPYLLYQPEELAYHAAKFGTTTFINDNLMLHFLFEKKEAFAFMEDLTDLPVSIYWSARYDSQTALQKEEQLFNTEEMLSWIERPEVVQGGKLTAWPRLLEGDDRLLYWLQKTKRLGKRVSGHLPGASEDTLRKLKLFGVTGDHEALTAEDVLKRLSLGYHVHLRHSSTRPDLEKIITELPELTNYAHLSLTTDGSTPSFYENGLINNLVEICIKNGVPIEETYKMASYNVAHYLHLDDEIGSIAPGKLAHINVLSEKENPHPVSVLAKGQWIVKDEEIQEIDRKIDWQDYDVGPLHFDWDVTMADLQFSSPIKLEMVSNVILSPKLLEIDSFQDHLVGDRNGAFLMLMDRHGKWRVNTMIQGFTKQLGGFVSSHSASGDIIFIGKNKQDMILAWQRMKELGGGIVLAHEGKIVFELPLTIGGMMFDGDMETLIKQEIKLKQYLLDFGYAFNDPIVGLYCLASTHLPYIRITQQGIYDIMTKQVLFPATLR